MYAVTVQPRRKLCDGPPFRPEHRPVRAPARWSVKCEAKAPLSPIRAMAHGRAVRRHAERSSPSPSQTLSRSSSRIRTTRPAAYSAVDFRGADSGLLIEGEEPRETKCSYFLGDEPELWVTGVPTFDGVRYRQLQPGIDLVIGAAGAHWKYDLRLSAGADPTSIRVRVEGAQALSLRDDGALVIQTEAGDLVQPLQPTFDVVDGMPDRCIPCCFKLLGGHRFSFEIFGGASASSVAIDPDLV